MKHIKRVFAISDLHLSFASPKPMDVFGEQWKGHAERIATCWRELIGDEDLVLLAGDFSWALKLEAAEPDLAWLAQLPGQKVMIKGNHDFWWGSIGKARHLAGENIHLIQNDMVLIDDIAIGGSRMWDFPDTRWSVQSQENPVAGKATQGEQREDDEKIRTREIIRLRNSLSRLPRSGAYKIAMVHFPPTGEEGGESVITKIMDEFRIDLCLFGHLHSLGDRARPGADCRIHNTRYLLTSCDWLGFKLLELELEITR